MHEAGIAAEILSIAEEQARQYHAQRIVEVKVRLGDLSGVVGEALEFAFDALKEGPARDARLDIERVAVLARCRACDVETRPAADLVLWCGHCSGPMEVLEGEELTVQSVVLESEES